MTWLVQYSGVNVTNTDHIMTILKAKNIPFVPVGIRPFTTEITGLEDADLSGSVMAYGSTKLVKLVMELGLRPGVFFDYSTFNAMAWKHFLRDKMANDALFVPIGTLRKFADNRADTVATETFIRPVMDLKLFSGSVKPVGVEFTDFLDEKLNGSRAFEQTIVAMSHPLKIQGEWRCFVVNRKFVTGSQYRINGELKPNPSMPDGIEEFVNDIANLWLPHDHCVVDVAMIDGSLEVMEFNCINASGLYEADAEKLVDALNSLCQ
jgi:hypothetical protein